MYIRSMMRLYAVKKALYPRHVFRISRAAKASVENVFLVLAQDGAIGYGEASPNPFYGEDARDVEMTLIGLADFFRRHALQTREDIETIWSEVWEKVAPSRACQCAVDLALWDLFAKLQRKTVCEIALGKPARPVATSATLGLCPREEWEDRLRELADFPAIKVKSDAEAKLDLLAFIRERSRAAIRVDANCAWSRLPWPQLAPRFRELGVEFIEQPLPPHEDERMAALSAASALPVLADESCAGPDDVSALVGRFSGFNVKLVKCGGLTPALRMLREGKARGLKVMIGCMLESSLLISAGLVAAQDADYADLDGSWLLRGDPFRGLSVTGGCVQPSRRPGFGVKPRVY